LKNLLRVGGRIIFLLLAASFVVIALEIVTGWRCDLRGQTRSPLPQLAEQRALSAGIKDYSRPEDDTFLSYPEWYIVWSYQEKADFQRTHLPSGFPYFAAVRQYWRSYCCISRLIRGKYEFNAGEQLMLVVIGTSFSAEYILKGVYENTIGRLSEWTSNHEATDEDRFSYQVAREYADFVHVRPFYEFHFARQVEAVWNQTPLMGRHQLRKWERKTFLTVDYTIEALYCWLIEQATHWTYGVEPTTTYAWVEDARTPTTLTEIAHVKVVKQVGAQAYILAIPRYQEFTSVAESLARTGVQFVEIAGNSQILISVLAPASWRNLDDRAHLLFATPVVTDRSIERSVIRCDVAALSQVLRSLSGSGATIEHVYDY
jgi:hypothetical protein